DAGPDMDAGETDAGATDAGATDAAVATDAGTTSPVDRFLTAVRTITAHYCMCDFTGFADAADCSSFGQNPVIDSCEEMAYAGTMAASAVPFDCLTTSREDYATCLGTAGCDDVAIGSCDDALSLALDACTDLPTEFGDMFDACVTANLVGSTPSPCPENPTASTMLGMAVFTGDTTGAGNDGPAGSCASVFCDTMVADRSYAWTATTAGTYVFDTRGSHFDTVLSITDGCAGSELACNDDLDSDDLRSSFSLALTAGQTVTIHVAGCTSYDAGGFQVNINAAP
ncbi:MAG: hypothetical protein H6719_09545, partial [Sandaracinaceae bacterium]|nr:hypothetical protein [Sandaracinaceae bacterium]